MTLLIIFIPLISFLIIGFLGRFIGNRGAQIITTSLIFINTLISIILFYQTGYINNNSYINLGNWISSGILQIEWNFFFDNLTTTMLIVVNTISCLVHFYSIDYMSEDPHINRFMSYLSLFTFFMIILITGDNFVLLFLGWEGVGLCSYLLINFWYTRLSANKSAMKALIVNRISDIGLTIAMICIYYTFKTLDFATVFGLAPYFCNKTLFFCGFEIYTLNLICILLFIGAMGKSAQIGLHTWLPDAMEGPTPVSALIHAATMVTAGVFLIIKCSPLFELTPNILFIVTIIGATTAVFAATVGLIQNDIKKVIAYSTCSQLGYMVLSCGLSQYHIGFYHLVNHAFFKALLFLSAGAIIHSLNNEQDMRKYGGLNNFLPFTSVLFLIGSLSLIGFPFLSGFYSKDLILEIAYSKYTIQGVFLYWIGLITAFLTSFYSYRVFYLTFICKSNTYRSIVNKIHELPWKMALSLVILAIGSIFIGYLTRDLFVGLGTDFWRESIYINKKNNNQIEAEFIPQIYKLLPFIGSMLAVSLLHILFYLKTDWIDLNLKPLYRFLSYKWYWDIIYNKLINKPILIIGYEHIFKLLDKQLFEMFGPYGISYVLYSYTWNLKKMNTGRIYQYGYFILLFLIINAIIYNIFICND